MAADIQAQQQALLQALQTVVDPNTGKDFVSSKALKNLHITDGDVSFDVELGYPAKSQMPGFRKALIAAARTVAGVDNVSVNLTTKITTHAVQRGVALLPNEKHRGRGLGQRRRGQKHHHRQPGAGAGRRGGQWASSTPTLWPQPAHDDGTKAVKRGRPDHGTLENHGLQVMSIGFLVTKTKP